MRTTVDIDDDVLRATKELARVARPGALDAYVGDALARGPRRRWLAMRAGHGEPVGAIMGRLAEAIASREHEFWPDDLSLMDTRIADRTRVHGRREVTDLYLLALAVRR